MDETPKTLEEMMNAADARAIASDPKALAAWNAVHVGDFVSLGKRPDGSARRGKIISKADGCITVDLGGGVTMSRTGRDVRNVKKVAR